jgi:galactokinase
VVTDSLRARAIAAALQDDSTPDSYPFTGKLLTEGHASLRDDFEVSWPQADATVGVAIEAGAYGAKMIGGGFGGSVLALLPAERLPSVRAALSASFVARGWTPPEFLEAIPAPPARRLA